MIRKCLLYSSLVLISTVSAEAAPKLKIAEETFDFGFTPEGLPVVHRYWVYNTGTDTLLINKVRPSCGCTTVPLPKSRLHPGDSVALELQFDTNRFKGKVTKTAAVETNDTTQAKAQLKFTANVGLWEGLISAKPNMVYLDTLGKSEQVIVLKNSSVAAYTIKITSPVKEFLSFDISNLELPGKGEATVRIRPTDKTPIGEYHSSVTFFMDGPEPHSLTVPIYGVGYVQ